MFRQTNQYTRALSLFDASNKMRDALSLIFDEAHSLDTSPGYKGSKVDFCTDILKWDYKAYSPDHYSFLFIALPCQAYSIASGALHFKKGIPVTSVAINAINILIRIYQITQYFNCQFIIENPAGGLINNPFFKSFFNLQVTRFSQSSFGFPTQKKTDLFYNFNMLLVVPATYRVNGRYALKSLSDLSYRQRVTYPNSFCTWLTQEYFKYMKSSV